MCSVACSAVFVPIESAPPGGDDAFNSVPDAPAMDVPDAPPLDAPPFTPKKSLDIVKSDLQRKKDAKEAKGAVLFTEIRVQR